MICRTAWTELNWTSWSSCTTRWLVTCVGVAIWLAAWRDWQWRHKSTGRGGARTRTLRLGDLCHAWPRIKPKPRSKQCPSIFTSANRPSLYITEMDMSWVHPWVGLGWVTFSSTFDGLGGLGWMRSTVIFSLHFVFVIILCAKKNSE